MKYAVIQRPSVATLAMLRHRLSDSSIKALLDGGTIEAVGICQGTVLEILVASDVAEKASGVRAAELNGSCPQHVTCLVILGDTEAVQAAMDMVKTKIQQL